MIEMIKAGIWEFNAVFQRPVASDVGQILDQVENLYASKTVYYKMIDDFYISQDVYCDGTEFYSIVKTALLSAVARKSEPWESIPIYSKRFSLTSISEAADISLTLAYEIEKRLLRRFENASLSFYIRGSFSRDGWKLPPVD